MTQQGHGYTVEPHTGPVGYFPQDPDHFPPVPDDPPYDAGMTGAEAKEWRLGGPGPGDPPPEE